MKRRLLALLVLVLVCSAPVLAQTNSTDEEDDEDDSSPVVNIDIGQIVEEIESLSDTVGGFKTWLPEVLAETLTSVLYEPFRNLLDYLASQLVSFLIHTPDVYPNEVVEEVHQQTLIVSFLLSGLAFMIAGLLHMIGPVLGVSYGEVRMILPRVIAALVFAAVSLPLLQYGVDLSDALAQAFQPRVLERPLQAALGSGGALVLVYMINASLILVVVAILAIRNIYILFVAAISPLIAIAWSLPMTKHYADSFISAWFTALLIGPIDMLVLKFAFSMMSGDLTTVQGIGDWVYGMGSLALLIWIPIQLYGSSQSVVGQASSASKNLAKGAKNERVQKQKNKLQTKLNRSYRRRKKKLTRSEYTGPSDYLNSGDRK